MSEEKNIYQILTEKFPFLSYGTYNEEDYVGIIQNHDTTFVMMYVYNKIQDEKLKKLFLEYSDEYYWSSNRLVPINIYFRNRFKVFTPYLMAFSAKDFNLICGPSPSIDAYMSKRIKRRTVALVSTKKAN